MIDKQAFRKISQEIETKKLKEARETLQARRRYNRMLRELDNVKSTI